MNSLEKAAKDCAQELHEAFGGTGSYSLTEIAVRRKTEIVQKHMKKEKRKLVRNLARRIKYRLESLTNMAMIYDAVDEECRKSMSTKIDG